MEKNIPTKRSLLEAIGIITESKRNHVTTLADVRNTINNFMKSVGASVPFVMSEPSRSRNEQALEDALTKAEDDDTREFLKTWKGPEYGDSLRADSYGIEWEDALGPVYGYIDAVRSEGESVVVDAVTETDILRHDVRGTVAVPLTGVADLVPVLRFLRDYAPAEEAAE